MSFTAILAVVVVVSKHLKKKQYHKRDARYESKLDAIMKAVGAEWSADISEPSRKSLINVGGITYMCSWVGKSLVRIVKRFINSNTRRKQAMKDYLKKLGKTKFQAYLVVTVVNIITFILYLKGYVTVDDQVNQWMPAINLGVQMVATAVYQWVEGSIDRAGAAASAPTIPPDNSGTDKSH